MQDKWKVNFNYSQNILSVGIEAQFKPSSDGSCVIGVLPARLPEIYKQHRC